MSNGGRNNNQCANNNQKRGVRSGAQKTEGARDGYQPIPPGNPVAGGFGDNDRDMPTDQDLALDLSTKRQQQRDDRNQGE